MAAALQYATGFRRDLPEKKWQRISRNIVAAMAAIKDSLNLDVSNSSLTELFPGSDIPEKLLSDIRLHFDSLPNSYSQAGFDIEEICVHLRLAKQAADDGQPAFQIQRISDQSNVFKIVFVCRSTFSLPTMSGAIGGSVICFKKTLIFEKKGFTLGVVTVCIDARFEKNFKHRIESALRSAAKNHRNAGVKLHFRLCGCREEGFVTLNENNSVFSAISEINARPIRRIHLPTPVPEIIFSGGAELSSRWLLRSEEIEFVERAGINSFIGTYRGKKVWIKKLKRCERGNAYEIEIQQKLIGLMSCGHKKLLQFCGICFNDGLCVVTRLMEGGSVHDLMQRKKVRVGDVVRIGLDVSEGLLFMNSHGLAYRDLNRKRILLDGEGHACLGDMGVVTTCMNPWQATEIRVSDGYQWLAPEIIAADPENKTETWMSNVYSFGMVLWEMVTGEVAYSSYSPVQAAVGIAAYGMRPEIPKDCPPVLRSLMIRCWNNSPSKRPQLSEIVAILSKKKISVG